MKLTDIVVLEAAPLGDDPVELKDVMEYFPSQYRKAMKAFAKNGRLRFGGDVLFATDGDNGPALLDAIKVAKRFLKDEPFELEIDFNTENTDLSEPHGGDRHPGFTLEAYAGESECVWVGYDVKADKLLLGFDAWINEDVFNDAWDEEFEQAFGEDFDMDNEDHEKVFAKAWKEFSNKQSMFGAVVEVNSGMHASMEDMPSEGGFYRGSFKNMDKTNIVELHG